MIRTKLALKVLTKKEQKHLTKDAGVDSMAAFVRTRDYHKKWKKETGDEPCYDCRHIAIKLGLEE